MGVGFSSGIAVSCAAKILKPHGIFLWDLCVPDQGSKKGCRYFVIARFVTPLGRGRAFKAGPYELPLDGIDPFAVAADFQRMCDGLDPEREAGELLERRGSGEDSCCKSLPASRAALARDALAEKEALWKCAAVMRAAASVVRLGAEAGGISEPIEEMVMSCFEPAPMDKAQEIKPHRIKEA